MAEEGTAASRPNSAEEPGDATQPFDAVRPDGGGPDDSGAPEGAAGSPAEPEPDAETGPDAGPEPDAETGPDARPGATDPDATAVTPAVRPPAADETRLDGTPVPPSDATAVAAPAAWSARAAVRPADPSAQAEEEWDGGEHDRPWLRPVVIALVAAVLLALLGTGVWLILRGSNSGSGPGAATSESASATPPATSAAPSATSAAPTSAAPTTTAPFSLPPPGAGQIPMPQVVGLPESGARQALEGLGLRVKVNRVPSTSAPGTVLSQQPPFGTMVNPGDQVTIVVAQAPPAPTTRSPSPSASN